MQSRSPSQLTICCEGFDHVAVPIVDINVPQTSALLGTNETLSLSTSAPLRFRFALVSAPDIGTIGGVVTSSP
jgi:hypothetical protein